MFKLSCGAGSAQEPAADRNAEQAAEPGVLRKLPLQGFDRLACTQGRPGRAWQYVPVLAVSLPTHAGDVKVNKREFLRDAIQFIPAAGVLQALARQAQGEAMSAAQAAAAGYDPSQHLYGCCFYFF